MKVKQSQVYRFYQGEKVPRKIKKLLLGLRQNKSKLRKRLKNVKVLNKGRCGDIELNDYFCPKCGCECQDIVDHEVGYPEKWVDYYCMRCGNHVAFVDNSPYTHCLTFPEYNYELPI